MQLSRLTWFGFALLAVAQAATGCGSSSGSSGPAQGTERGSCYGNGTCNAGLRCFSDLCVVASGGSAGEAGAVAEGGTTQAGNGGTNAGGTNGVVAGAGGMSGGSAGAGAAIGEGGAGAGGEGGASVAAPCDPVLQTGCGANQRCTWILSATPSQADVGCLPEGTLNLGDACTPATPSGGDDCKSGSVCLNGTCEAICDPTGAEGPACPSTRTCVTYSGLFSTSDSTTAFAGVCESTCDPFTQKRNTDGAAACGSPNPSAPTLGCYGAPGYPFQCAPVGSASNTSDVALPAVSFLNSCAPGFVPVLTQSTASTVLICVALCKPEATSSAAPAGAAGDTKSAFTCPDRGAGGTHECRFWWKLEGTSPDANGNTVGYCDDYTKYTYSSNGGPSMTTPSCTTLSPTAHTFDTTKTDAEYWGCQPLP